MPKPENFDSTVFNTWTPENPCFSCPAKCCRDSRIQLGQFGTLKKLSGVLYPHIVNPDEFMSEQEFANVQEEGVYWVVGNSGRHYLKLRGACPKLDQDTLQCTAHDKLRPWGCGFANPSNTHMCPE